MSHLKKNILIVSPYFYPNIEWGGPVTVSLNHAVALKNAGYQVTVLTTDASNPDSKLRKNFVNESGVKIIYANSILPKLAWNFRMFLSIDQIFKGWKLIPKFDVVHFQDCFIIQNVILSVRCRSLKIPYVITPHGSLSFAKERGKSLFKWFFMKVLSASYLNRCLKILAVSEAEKKAIDQGFPNLRNKTIYIPNIIQKEDFRKVDLRSKLNIPGSDLILLFLGRIYQLKGAIELASGFLEFLRRYNKNATLIFAGPDAGAASEIKKLLIGSQYGSKVIFTGEVTGDFKSNIIYNSDVVCLLSKSESMPTVLLEAASFAKPIICSKECNMNDLIDYGGALLTTTEPRDIAKNINRLRKQEDRFDIGRKARDWFDKNFDTTKIVNKYKHIYANTTAK